MTDLIQPMFAIILVLALLGGTLWFLRRRGMASFPSATSPFGKQAGTRQMKVVERIPLGAQHALHLVKVGDRLIVVATAPGSCQMMASAQQTTDFGIREVAG